MYLKRQERSPDDIEVSQTSLCGISVPLCRCVSLFGIRPGPFYFYPASSAVVLALLCVLFGCGRPGGRQSTAGDRDQHLQTIYVDESEIDQQSSSEVRSLRVLVKGSLPSPAYEFQKFAIAVNEDTVIVTPLAKSDNKRMVAQVLVPFSEVCLVRNLEPGIYHVKVAGRGQSVYLGTSIVE